MKEGVEEQLLNTDLIDLIESKSLKEIADLYNTTISSVFKVLKIKMNAGRYFEAITEARLHTDGAWINSEERATIKMMLL